jgi:hypothetical protein
MKFLGHSVVLAAFGLPTFSFADEAVNVDDFVQVSGVWPITDYLTDSSVQLPGQFNSDKAHWQAAITRQRNQPLGDEHYYGYAVDEQLKYWDEIDSSDVSRALEIRGVTKYQIIDGVITRSRDVRFLSALYVMFGK